MSVSELDLCNSIFELHQGGYNLDINSGRAYNYGQLSSWSLLALLSQKIQYLFSSPY